MTKIKQIIDLLESERMNRLFQDANHCPEEFYKALVLLKSMEAEDND
jgi:hypothetical protein